MSALEEQYAAQLTQQKEKATEHLTLAQEQQEQRLEEELRLASQQSAEQLKQFEAKMGKDLREAKRKIKELEAAVALGEKQLNVAVQRAGDRVKKDMKEDFEKAKASLKQETEERVAAKLSKDFEQTLAEEVNKTETTLRGQMQEAAEVHEGMMADMMQQLRKAQQPTPKPTSQPAQPAANQSVKRMVEEAKKENLPVDLAETEQEGVYKFGVRKVHLVAVDKKLSVRVGGGYMSFTDFVHKFGEKEARKIRKASMGVMSQKGRKGHATVRVQELNSRNVRRSIS